jgi:methylphosphotriester-DNA--protein-cysteine methyltransferase
MITHLELGDTAFKRSRRLKMLIDKGEAQLAGNSKLRIYGTLRCASGKRMKMDNRVFFVSEAEAKSMSYRPCGHCMREAYLKWKAASTHPDIAMLVTPLSFVIVAQL